MHHPVRQQVVGEATAAVQASVIRRVAGRGVHTVKLA